MVHSVLLTGSERRRSWSREQRERILAEAFAPGAIASAVARRHEVSSGLLYTWRKNAERRKDRPGFLRALVSEESPASERAPCVSDPAIVVELLGGVRIIINASATEPLIAATLRALR